MAGLLLASFALGIVWADRTFSAEDVNPATTGLASFVWPSPSPSPSPSLTPMLTVAVALALAGVLPATIFALRRASALARSRRERPRRGSGPLVLGSVRLLCLVIAFQAGAARLDDELTRAARDAARAEALVAETSSRRIDAVVRSRRSTAWGVEVELGRVRAIDGRAAVPERLRVSVPVTPGTARVVVSEAAGEDRGGHTNARRISRAERWLWPGAAIRAAVRIRTLTSRRNPGLPGRARRDARAGLAARARLVDPDWIMLLGEESASPQSWLDRRRAWLERTRSARIDRIAGAYADLGGGAGLARALAVGDRRGLSESVRSAFRRLGLSHLIAVSGLHVGLVAGLGGLLFGGLVERTGIGLGHAVYGRFGWAILFGVGGGGTYAWFAGAPPSSMRALALLMIFAIARVSRRESTPARALAWAAFGMLALAPGALFEVGPQLAFAACGALIGARVWQQADAGSERPAASDDRRSAVRFGRWARDGFWTSVAVSLGTSPFLLAAGMPLAWVAPAINLLAIPWTGLVVLPASLVAALGADVLPRRVLEGLLAPADWSERAAVAVHSVPEWPSAAVMPFSVAVAAAGLGVLAMRFGARRLGLVLWILLATSGVQPLLHGPDPPATPRVVFFDVGQGDAALVEADDGTMLVDTGGGALAATAGRALVHSLRALGATRIDLLAVTHGDLDHRGGARRVLAELDVGALWLPDGGQDDARLAELAAEAVARGVSVSWRSRRNARSAIGDLGIDVLWPPPALGAGESLVEATARSASTAARASRNDGSLVLRVELGGQRVLFTGDVGRDVEARLLESPERLRAEILKLGHHGSRKSTSAAFLEAVAPVAAVASAPCAPTRGLPNRAVLERVEAHGIRLGWTGRDGALVWAPERGSLDDEWFAWGDPRRCRGHASRSDAR